MTYEAILVDKSDGVGTVTLNRPEKPVSYTHLTLPTKA